MKIKIKKLVPEAQIPIYATAGSNAMDIVAVSKKIIDKGNFGYVEYGTGLAFEVPEGYGLFLLPRSSISKTGLILANSVGLVDSDYRGEVSFRFKHISGTSDYNIGDRIGQLLILETPKIEFEEVQELSETERGTGGYGSTGI